MQLVMQSMIYHICHGGWLQQFGRN